MKTIFTLLLSSLFTLSSMAYEGTRLTIASISTNKMSVEVDGRKFKMDDKGIYIRDLRSGYHTVKIFSDVKKKNGRGFDFGIGRNRQDAIYDNRVFLKEGFHYDILINRFGKVMLDERRIDRNDDWYNDDDDNQYDRNNNRDRDNKDYNKDYDRNRDNGDYDKDRNRNNDYDDRYNNSRTMNTVDFNQAKERLRRDWFENTRVTTAKQIMDANYFTSQQVKELLQLFTFEDNKLVLAKYAYNKTTDRNNYYVVSDVFTYNNSKDELARYIRDYR